MRGNKVKSQDLFLFKNSIAPDDLVDFTGLKKIAIDRLSLQSTARQMILQEPDLMERNEALIKGPVYFRMIKKELGR